MGAVIRCQVTHRRRPPTVFSPSEPTHLQILSQQGSRKTIISRGERGHADRALFESASSALICGHPFENYFSVDRLAVAFCHSAPAMRAFCQVPEAVSGDFHILIEPLEQLQFGV